MHWIYPLYPQGWQPPGMGLILLIGGIVFCLIGIAIYLAMKAVFAQGSPPAPASPDNPARSGARHHRTKTGGQEGQLRP